jgi:hypothetical protein
MSDLKLLDSGELAIDNFDLVIVTGVDALVQRLAIKLRHFLGEWFLDTSFGVPYYEHVMKKNPDPAQMHAAFTNAILSTPGVVRLLEYDIFFDPFDRELQVDARILTVDGVTDLAEVLQVI